MEKISSCFNLWRNSNKEDQLYTCSVRLRERKFFVEIPVSKTVYLTYLSNMDTENESNVLYVLIYNCFSVFIVFSEYTNSYIESTRIIVINKSSRISGDKSDDKSI